ncbi:MAG: hypothetical protein IT525_09035 [Nitrosomonas sp.]|nr:hypothetical protein [Nitrosomonas sp.]
MYSWTAVQQSVVANDVLAVIALLGEFRRICPTRLVCGIRLECPDDFTRRSGGDSSRLFGLRRSRV